MSSECFVRYERTPDDAENRVMQMLSSLGYDCEFAPHTAIFDPDSEGLAIRVRNYPTVKPRVYPEREFIVEIGVEHTITGSASEPKLMCFRSTAGRSKLEIGLQFLIAGALAELSGGQLYDAQEEEEISSDAAVQYALQLVREYGQPHELREQQFFGWTV